MKTRNRETHFLLPLIFLAIWQFFPLALHSEELPDANREEEASASTGDEIVVDAWSTNETIHGPHDVEYLAYTDGTLLYTITDLHNACVDVADVNEDAYIYQNSDNRILYNITIPHVVRIYGREYRVTSIGVTDYGISGDDIYGNIIVPNSVTTIGYYDDDQPGIRCPNLTSIIVEAGNPVYDSRNNCNAVIETKSNKFICGCLNSTIPNSVTAIGDGAFLCYSGLKSITIPNSVTSIGSWAFTGCTGLTSITIGNGVTSIGQMAFYRCTGLTSVYITDLAAWCQIDFGDKEANPLYHIHHLFLNGEEVKDLVIPNSVTSIGNHAFYECTGLKSVTIPNSVTTIGNYAFLGCTGLTSVTIPNSVTTIGRWAFFKCSALASITIGNGVTSIGDDAFSGCSGLTDLVIDTENFGDWFKGNTSIKNLTIGNSVKSIEGNAFSGCTGLTTIIIPPSVTNIGSSAFSGTAWYNNQPDGLVYAGNVAYKYKGTMPENTRIELKNDCTGIAGDAFKNCTGLTSINIPNSVTSIGSRAFQDCTGLTSINIGNSVTSIEGYAFENCSGLTSITIGNGVTSIGYNAFKGCTGLTSFTIPNSVTSIGSGAFQDCTGLTSINIGNSVTSIGSSAFSGTAWYNNQPDGLVYAGNVAYKYKGTMPENTRIELKNDCTGIAGDAFKNCTGLTSINIPNSVTSIGSWAFYGCSELTSITIPNSVTSIGDYAFCGCTGLTSITIGNGVTSIGYNAFKGCTGLTSITIGNGVTSIGYNAFKGCTGLTSFTIPNSVTSIGSGAFQDCTGLTSINIGNSVTSIGSGAFQDCTGLTSINIGNSVTSIGPWAFFGCTGLTDVYATRKDATEYNADFWAFGSDSYNCICSSTLHIPTGSYISYASTVPWCYFRNFVEEDPTGIDEVVIKEDEEARTPIIVDYYDLQGRPLKEPLRGINIIRYNDGTSKKVLIK